MKVEKQREILEIFKLGKYKAVNGLMYSHRKSSGIWVQMSSPRLPTGYRQVSFSGEHGKIVCYHHIAIYLFCKGEYPDGFKIDHIDRNNHNDLPDNLEAKTQKGNITNSPQKGGGCNKTIRDAEIKAIRKLYSEGMSQQGIAEELDLNRLSVRYTVRNIKAGNVLKYEKAQTA